MGGSQTDQVRLTVNGRAYTIAIDPAIAPIHTSARANNAGMSRKTSG